MLMIPRRFRGGGNIARLPASVLYDEYQQAGTRRRHPFYAPPPRLTKMAPLDMGAGPSPPGNIIVDAPLAGRLADSAGESFEYVGAYEGMARKKDGALGPFGGVPPVFILVCRADASCRCFLASRS
ncbi:hypothetical protein HID58_022583 [Brassica napus]|uniref:Uncharacterized protein n=1 Tax=Brassica napus TaxID=3708 RepID=A0ABQ8CZQ1_BRANA|nr:hypothetical protein HID58_022583 [Brassica napus]